MVDPVIAVAATKAVAVGIGGAKTFVAAKIAAAADAGSHAPMFHDAFSSQGITDAVWGIADKLATRSNLCQPDIMSDAAQHAASRPLPQHLALGVRIPPVEPRVEIPLPKFVPGLPSGSSNPPPSLPIPPTGGPTQDPSGSLAPNLPPHISHTLNLGTACEKCRDGISNVQMAVLLTATNVTSFFLGSRSRA